MLVIQPLSDGRRYLAAAADLVFGLACAGCGAPGVVACPVCRAALERVPAVAEPVPRPTGLPTVVASAEYAGPVRAMLVAYKEQSSYGLAQPLGAALARSCLAVATGAPPGTRRLVLVALPSPAARIRQRGHDPLARLSAIAVARLRGWGIDAMSRRCLTIVRTVADQAGLSAEDRLRNLDGAFGVRPRDRLDGISAIVVDDIVTTGASARAAASALACAGARVLGVAVVAATARRVPFSTASPHLDRSTSSVDPWHSPGSVVAPTRTRVDESRIGKPMPAAGETAHVRRSAADHGAA